MTKEQLIKSLREKPEMLEAVNGDGHGLYSVEFYTSKGWDSDFVAPMNRRHVSDGSVKGSMFDGNGNIIAEQVAVYSLDFHERLAVLLDVDGWTQFFGRGTTARFIAEQVRKMIEARS